MAYMSEPEQSPKPYLSPKYRQQLEAYATSVLPAIKAMSPEQVVMPPDEIVDQLANWRFTESDVCPREHIPYVRVGRTSDRPVLFVPGFTEGIIAKAPLALVMAMLGRDIILPGQNRKSIWRDGTSGRPDATGTQAKNMANVLRAAVTESDRQVDVVTHSYGSLIFDRMVQHAVVKGQDMFERSNVVMLAPAGFNANETPAKLARRFVAMLLQEAGSEKDFNATPAMLRAGITTVGANIPRALAEVKHLASERVDTSALLQSIGSLCVLVYGEDVLYSQELLAHAMDDVVAAGGAWAMPISLDLQNVGKKNTRWSIRGATHNDEQFHPMRVGLAVFHILKQAQERISAG